MDSLFYGAANCSSNTVDKNSENKHVLMQYLNSIQQVMPQDIR